MMSKIKIPITWHCEKCMRYVPIKTSCPDCNRKEPKKGKRNEKRKSRFYNR